MAVETRWFRKGEMEFEVEFERRVSGVLERTPEYENLVASGAAPIVGPSEQAKDSDPEGYAALTKSELQEEVARRELDIRGNASKAVLIEALEASDAADVDEGTLGD